MCDKCQTHTFYRRVLSGAIRTNHNISPGLIQAAKESVQKEPDPQKTLGQLSREIIQHVSDREQQGESGHSRIKTEDLLTRIISEKSFNDEQLYIKQERRGRIIVLLDDLDTGINWVGIFNINNRQNPGTVFTADEGKFLRIKSKEYRQIDLTRLVLLEDLRRFLSE